MIIALLVLFLLLIAFLFKDQAIGLLTWLPAQRVPVLPGNRPILGHSLVFLSNLQHRFHDWLLEEARSLGDGITFAYKLPFQSPSYIVTSRACVHYVLKTNMQNYEKGKVWVDIFGPLVGHTLFTSDGNYWLWQRKLVMKFLSVNSHKSYLDGVFAQKMGLLHAIVQRAVTNHTQLNLHELMLHFTMDSFCFIGYSTDPGCLTSSGEVPFAAAFDKLQELLGERFYIPAWPVFEFLTGRTLAISRNCAVVKRFGADIIARRRALLANTAAGNGKQDNREEGCDTDKAPRDLLSLLLEAVRPDDKPVDDEWVLNMVVGLVMAGRDTTAQALSWTLYLLLQHPDVEDKLLAEIKAVLGDAAAEPSFEQIGQLRYARACVLETLRLHPPAPQELKFAVEADVLPDGTHIPKHARVIYSPFIVNRLKSFWGEDADEFRPERWLAMEAQPSSYSFLSFNAGQRICPGQRLAELQAVYMLTGLMARWRFRQVVPGQRVDYALSTMLPMKQGLQVFVEPRGCST